MCVPQTAERMGEQGSGDCQQRILHVFAHSVSVWAVLLDDLVEVGGQELKHKVEAVVVVKDQQLQPHNVVVMWQVVQ